MKFLSQYGRFKNFHAGAPFAFAPTLDETQASKAMLIGSVEEVADGLGEWMDVLDLRHLMVSPSSRGSRARRSTTRSTSLPRRSCLGSGSACRWRRRTRDGTATVYDTPRGGAVR